MKIGKKLPEFKEKVGNFKEKLSDIDKSFALNWHHILAEKASLRSTSRGIKIELRKKKEVK